MNRTSLLHLAVALAAASLGAACANGGPEIFVFGDDGGQNAADSGTDGDDGGGGGSGGSSGGSSGSVGSSSGGSQQPAQGSVCASPYTTASCHSCSQSSSKCQPNGCYGGYLCDTQTNKCRPPDQCP